MAHTYQAGSRHQIMYSYKSTQSLLELFPMFGHPGISAFEYAGTIEPSRKRNTSVSLSPKRKIVAKVHNEYTTSPTTAETDLGKAEPAQVINEFAGQQRRRGRFVNHTPRDFETRSASQRMDVQRPSRPDNENYSRPRASPRVNASKVHHESTGQHDYDLSGHSTTTEKRITINRGAPVELDSKEVVLVTAPEIHVPSAEVLQRSFSMPTKGVATYQSKSIIPAGCTGREVNVRRASISQDRQSEKKQRRQTPHRIATSKSTNVVRHAPLEPLVALHRLRGTNTKDESSSSHTEESDGETTTSQVIHRYFESQANKLSQSSSVKRHIQLPDPHSIPLPSSPEPTTPRTLNTHVTFPPTMELEMPSEPPPAVPDRSPKRLKNPSFPLRTLSVATTDSNFAFAAEGQYSPHDKKGEILHVHKKRMQKRNSVGQAARAGSSNVGRMAPPILGHVALTASSDLGLNDISSYLRNTGPIMDTQITARQRKKSAMRMFRVKSKKSLVARVGSVEGCPQGARKSTPVPACAREMTTSSGAKHLKIVTPADTLSSTQMLPVPVANTKAQRRSKYSSIPFVEEMLSPLIESETESIIAVHRQDQTTSASVMPHNPPGSPKREQVRDYLLASREEQTRARKLRDLQRARGKPHMSDTQQDAPPTPAHTPSQGDSEERSSEERIARLEERVDILQKLNVDLTETLAKLVVGVEYEKGAMRAERVFRARRQIGCDDMLMVVGSEVEEERGTVEGELGGGEERLKLDFDAGRDVEVEGNGM